MAAYEQVDRAVVTPARGPSVKDYEAQRQIDQLYDNLQMVTREVVTCHNMIQSGQIFVPAGALTVIVPIKPLKNTFYIPVANVTTFNAWAGYAMVTAASRTLTQFGLTFSAAPPVGGGVAFWMLIN